MPGLLKFRLTIHTILGSTIALLGILSLGLALVSGEIHRHLTLENHRASLVQLIQLKANDLLSGLANQSKDLGLALQSSARFREAFDRRDPRALTGLLNKQFHQYFVTAGVLRLKRLVAYDSELNLLVASTEIPTARDQLVHCPNIAARARHREGASRTRVLDELCLIQGRPYHSVLVPIGGLVPRGYLEVVTDPAHGLKPIERALGMPLRLEYPDGDTAYRSSGWPGPDAMKDSFVIEHSLRTSDGRNALRIGIVNDMRQLHADLRHARRVVMLVAGAATVLTAALALLLLRSTLLRPIRTLARQLHRVREDRSHLKDKVTVSGTSEVRELADDFNAMATELSQLYETLETMAYTDSLTNLPNRNLFHDRLLDITRLYQGHKRPFALLLMDLDRFKGVNDTLGHHIGDQLLQQVSTRLKTVMRTSDFLGRIDVETIRYFESSMIARLGGDEFAAILPSVRTAQEAAAVAHKLIDAMKEPFEVNGHKLVTGVSIGIALYPEHGTDVHTLMRKADVAMYHAKNTRRGFALFDVVQENQNILQLTLEPDLLRAIENDELVLHFQPTVIAPTGTVCRCEVLLRWEHPEKGSVPPDYFIPLAEQTGLIQRIRAWVLRNAFRSCDAWHRLGLDVGISVNLSAVDLHDPGLLTEVRAALQTSRLSPCCVTFELTESAVMSDPEYAFDVLTSMDAMGIQLSIDDFGTGYSSLAYIKRLPVTEIKIDKSFILDMNEDPNDEAIVRATIGLAHTLGLEVVAEGVETEETAQRLLALGCDRMQGHWISPALPYSRFIEWMGCHEGPNALVEPLGARRHPK